jgi:Predicted restriction endonuclease
MDSLHIGQAYTANELAQIWNYQDFHAIARGIVTPKNCNRILLFVTQTKAADRVPYMDKIDGDILYMAGQLKHKTDNRIVSNIKCHKDEFHLFFREVRNEPFTYYGQCSLINATINDSDPSEFEFLIHNSSGFEDEEGLIDYLANMPENSVKSFLEGTAKISQHIRYERNPKNRKAAIRAQGTICKICGFDFNKIYGKDLANDYIEVHHIRQLSEGIQNIDPAKDLIPVCANCHRMLHRKRQNNISVNQLQNCEGAKWLLNTFQSNG